MSTGLDVQAGPLTWRVVMLAVIWELSGAVGGGTQGSLSSRTALGEKVEKAHCFNHQA